VTVGSFLLLAGLVLVGGGGVHELRDGVVEFIRSRRGGTVTAAEPST
jgi:hypothetical protein